MIIDQAASMFYINEAIPPRGKRDSIAILARGRAGVAGRGCPEYDAQKCRKECQ